MRILFKSAIAFIGVCFLFSTTSCLVVAHRDQKRGWTKNSNNPHHPNTTNPGKGNKKGKH
ncbi:MAG TPA: hypothetical protein VF868_04955 [Bacteroidia bacterium]|jgi:hypothetical protein